MYIRKKTGLWRKSRANIEVIDGEEYLFQSGVSEEYDLGIVDGIKMLASFCKIRSQDDCLDWFSNFGAPYPTSEEHYNDNEVYPIWKISDILERALSIACLQRLASVAGGASESIKRSVVIWPADDPAVLNADVDNRSFDINGGDFFRYSAWCDLPGESVLSGRAFSSALFHGRVDLGSDSIVGFLPQTSDYQNWRGELLPPSVKEEWRDELDYSVKSFVDFFPVKISAFQGKLGFDEVVIQAANQVLISTLPALLEGIGPSFTSFYPDGKLRAYPSFVYPSPYALMAYQIYRTVTGARDFITCRCGAAVKPRTKTQTTCGKPACTRYATRNK